MNVKELKRIYEDMKGEQFDDTRELMSYVDRNIATVRKSDSIDYTFEKNGMSLTLCFGHFYPIQQMVEDITRAIQILNGLEIEGVHNTHQLISKLDSMKFAK